MAVALPFGGVGTGSIALAGDGGLRQVQCVNVVNHLGHIPNSFFAFKSQINNNKSQANILMSPECYDQSHFVPAPMITDHIVPKASIELLKTYPSIEKLQLTAKFPSATIEYLTDLQLKVKQEVFSPFIPLDSKNSGIPIIFFQFTILNTNDEIAKCSLLGTQQNFVGWNGQSTNNGVNDPLYGGNINTIEQTNNYSALHFSNESLRNSDSQNGEVVLAIVNDENLNMSFLPQTNDLATIWQQFSQQDNLSGGTSGPSPKGSTWIGAMECNFILQPQEQRQVTFALSWYFPNRYVNWSQQGFGINDPKSNFYIGNNYALNFKSALDIINYSITNQKMLQTTTELFRERMYNSTLPWQLIDSAAGRLSVLRSPSCMWLENSINNDGKSPGIFVAFEGCSTNDGCCPLNCTHVWCYEQALANCFPDLEQSMRNIDFLVQLSPNSILPSRTTVPLDLKRQWNDWKNYTEVDPASTAICVDGEIGSILKLYREIRQGASQQFFDACYPKAVNIINRWMSVLDSKGNGIIYEYPQPNTYDCSIYSCNTFMGTYYLCGLKAMSEMAKLQGDVDLQEKCLKRFLIGSENLEKLCFTNGTHYTSLESTQKNQQVEILSTSTFVDCLIGQWWSILLDTGDLLSIDHIKSTLVSIFAQNHRDSFTPDEQYPRKFYDTRDAGMFVADWGNDPIPKNAMLYTREGAWTGLTYAYVGLCIAYDIDPNIWLHVLTDIRNRQDGTRRSPWNEIECGDHYTRPMSSWALFNIAGGVLFNACNGMLTLAPKLMNNNVYNSLLILSDGWGVFTYTSTSIYIICDYGQFQLASIRVKNISTTQKIMVTLDGVNIEISNISENNNYTQIVFKNIVTIKQYSKLSITSSSSS